MNIILFTVLSVCFGIFHLLVYLLQKDKIVAKRFTVFSLINYIVMFLSLYLADFAQATITRQMVLGSDLWISPYIDRFVLSLFTVASLLVYGAAMLILWYVFSRQKITKKTLVLWSVLNIIIFGGTVFFVYPTVMIILIFSTAEF